MKWCCKLYSVSAPFFASVRIRTLQAVLHVTVDFAEHLTDMLEREGVFDHHPDGEDEDGEEDFDFIMEEDESKFSITYRKPQGDKSPLGVFSPFNFWPFTKH